MRIASLIALVALAITVVPAPASAADGWTVLGSRTVNDRTERDTIRVGKKHGRLTTLKLDVQQAPIEINRMVIRFGNGEEQILERDRLIGKRGNPTLDLDGGARIVKSVTFVYEATSPGFKKAKVVLLGR